MIPLLALCRRLFHRAFFIPLERPCEWCGGERDEEYDYLCAKCAIERTENTMS